MISFNALPIAERFPPGLLKRWPGYALARARASRAICSTSWPAAKARWRRIISAELKIVPLPEERGVGLIFFASVAEAMQATAELLDLKPAAIEHIDRPLFDQTRGQREFQAVRDLLELDARPCEAILIVEFFEDVHGRLAQLKKRKLGLRKLILETPEEAGPRVGDAQGRSVAADQLQGRRQTRGVRRGRGGAAARFAGICRQPAKIDAARWGCRRHITATRRRDCCTCGRCWICTARRI